MKLIISEAHSVNNYCIPMVSIKLKNKKELPNIVILNDKKYEEENCLNYPNFVNFTYGFFDSLSTNTINKLNSIYSITEDYISSKLWTYFTLISELKLRPFKKINKHIYYQNLPNPLDYSNHLKIKKYFNKKTISKNNNDNVDNIVKLFKSELDIVKRKFPFLNRSTTKVSDYLFFPYDVDIYLMYEMLSNGYNSTLIVSNEVEANNEIDLLYSFMDFIFSSKFNYYIKKCEQCGKFYISNKSDTKYCNRLDPKNRTCKNLATKNRVKYGKLKEYAKVDKRVRAFFSRQDYTVNDQFLKDYSNFRNNNVDRTAEDTIQFLEKYRKDYEISLTKE